MSPLAAPLGQKIRSAPRVRKRMGPLLLCALIGTSLSRTASAQAGSPTSTPAATAQDASAGRPLYTVDDPLMEPEPTAPDSTPDLRLNKPVSVTAKSRTLRESLAQLTRAFGVHLEAAPEISQRRVTILISPTKPLPLRTLMKSLAAVARAAWRDGTGGGYTLYQTDAQKRREARLIEQETTRERVGRAAQSAAMLRAMQEAIAGRDADAFSEADLLADLSQDQMQSLADLQTHSISLYAADNQSAYDNHVYALRPFNDLSPTQQAGVRALLNRPDYQPNSDGFRLSLPVTDPSSLTGCRIGFVGAEGRVGLAILAPGATSAWISPLDALGRKGVPGVDAGCGETEEERDLQSGLVLLLGELSYRQRRQTLRFPVLLNRTRLADVLESISSQTGLPIVADDYYRSRDTPFSWLLTDQDSYPLETALSQVAHAFLHQVRCRDGVVRVRSLLPGRDLGAEPPDVLTARLREMTKKREAPALSDYLMFGRLSEAQMNVLLTKNIPEAAGQLPFLLNMQRMHPVLAFYASLPETQRAQAEQSDGLSLRQMEDGARRSFASLADVGMPSRTQPAASNPKEAGLVVKHKSGTNTWMFLVTSPSGRVTGYSL